MIDLHERLSEFTYGYAVTKEFEKRLTQKGLKAVPYLPSLKQEKKVGFDVGYKDKGQIFMLQFKLGQELTRLHVKPPPSPRPKLNRPFFRFTVDTKDDQFMRLLGHESKGATVFYIAPEFRTWEDFSAAYHARTVINSSVMIRPSEIQAGLNSTKQKAGIHKVVYDDQKARHVFSERADLPYNSADAVVDVVAEASRASNENFGQQLQRLFDDQSFVNGLERTRRDTLMRQMNQRADAVLETLGAEAMGQGSQLIFVKQTRPRTA